MNDERGTVRKWEWFRQAQPNGFGLGGLVHGRILGFGGRVREGNRPRMKPRISEWMICKWE